ncbi:hypothetical protein ACFE04_031174 [Oxalis oulophora]
MDSMESNKGSKRRPSISHLPEELQIEILRRLPEAKYVIRCNLVCKNWYRLISSTCFIQSFLNHHHHHRNNINNKISHFVSQCPKSQQNHFPAFLVKDKGIRESKSINNIDEVTVVASCNDLLLCRLQRKRGKYCIGTGGLYCICNPLTKEYAILPPTHPITFSRVLVGFDCDDYYLSNNNNNNNDDDDDNGERRGGHDHSSSVMINPDYNFRIVLIWNTPDGKMRTRQFSSQTKEWRDSCFTNMPEPRPDPFNDSPEYMERVISYKGIMCWLDHISHICIYDPQNITTLLYIVPTPRPLDLGISAIGFCHGVLRIFLLTDDFEGDEVQFLANVWELKDLYSGEWSLVHSFPLYLDNLWDSGIRMPIYGTLSLDQLQILTIDPNDPDIVYLLVDVDRNILSCNLREMKIEQFQAGPFVPELSYIPIHGLIYPVMAPMWPTPIRSPVRPKPIPSLA